MSISRWVMVSARISLATAWAACLVVLGLWVLLDGAARMPLRACIGVGGASVAGGIFLFMAMVADRLFPMAGRRRSIWVVEMATFVVFLAGCVSALLSYGGSLA